MKRWHEDRKIMLKNKKLNSILFMRTNYPMGKFRKSHPCDCGNAQCHLCHADKYPKREQTDKEKLADLKLKEQREDID